MHRAGRGTGHDLGLHLPISPTSDHAHFADCGIPALRLVAGFDAPDSALRFLLTGADTRALVPPAELKSATLTAGAILWAALNAGRNALAPLRFRLPAAPSA